MGEPTFLPTLASSSIRGDAGAPVPIRNERGLDLRPFESVVDRLRADIAHVFGDDVWLETVEFGDRLFSHLLRAAVHRPGQSVAVSHVFLKVSKRPARAELLEHTRNKVVTDFATMAQVFEAFHSSNHFAAVRPLACYPEHLAIVTEQLSGETLLDCLQRKTAWSPRTPDAELREALTRTGAWIQSFQAKLPLTSPQPIPPIDTYIDERLRPLASRFGEEGVALRRRVLAHITALSEAAGESVNPVVVHADLSPSNVIVNGDRIAVLDFAMTRSGHPLQDVARLFTQLDMLTVKPQFRRTSISTLQMCLLQGVSPNLSPSSPGLRLQIIAQRINHLASLTARRYSWRERGYNWLVKRAHRAWLARELDTPVDSTKWV